MVNAVEPLLLRHGGVWVATGAGEGDREAVERADGVRVPPTDPRYRLRRVWLNDAEREGYYEKFANSALWPLCHRTSVVASFEPAAFAHYELVNRRFADAVADEARAPNPIVFAHDYHFALAPEMIRRQLPQSRIATFWHIPWPTPDTFDACPWSAALLKGLLGSTLIGFQTPADRRHFERCAEWVASVDAATHTVHLNGRRTVLGVYPAAIDSPPVLVSGLPTVAACRSEVRTQLGIPDDVILGVGVDRLDYSKGLEEKFLAIERLLERATELKGRFTFMQVAEPSRERIPAYQQTRERVFALVDRINERYPASRPAIVLSPTHHARPDVLRLMRAAEFCYVGSLHDGMNLVSKEFVAARDDEQGVLVLSENAGASVELRQALIVDPRNTEQVAHALRAAITMSGPEQRRRMRQMRSTIAAWDARAWSTAILNSVINVSAQAFAPPATASTGASMRDADRATVG